MLFERRTEVVLEGPLTLAFYSLSYVRLYVALVYSRLHYFIPSPLLNLQRPVFGFDNGAWAEKSNCVYQSVPDSSSPLKSPAHYLIKENSENCVEIDRQVVSSITTTLTTTYNAPVVGWCTFIH